MSRTIQFKPLQAICLMMGLILSTSLTSNLQADDKGDTAVKAAPKKEAAKKSTRKILVRCAEIEIKGGYPEGPKLPGIFGASTESLTDALGRIKKAGDDKSVSSILLKINSLSMTWGKLNEFKQAIEEFKKTGKPVYAWMEMGTNGSYLLASYCDKVFMPESGMLLLNGLRAEVGFYKNMFDKLDIKADVLRVGKFKAAAEPYTRTEMSPEFRGELQRVLDDRYEMIVDALVDSRGLDKKTATHIIDNGPYSAVSAKEAGLLDGMLYEDELKAQIASDQKSLNASIVENYGKKKVDTNFEGFNGMIKMMNLLSGVKSRKRSSSYPKIAVIYANGAIMSGKSTDGVMGSKTMVKAIEKAASDSTVKAVVLRVNSPGGSALASDIIWHSLEKLKKPFVVSMGDVAASGGYYIAMGGDRIFAEPGTITGSIGVVGMKFALDGLYKKMGINTSVVTRGGNSGAISMTMPMTNSEEASMKKMMLETYEEFTSKAAKGRTMDLEKLKSLAGGRIYTGDAALKNGLIDELGTLNDAIAHAKKLAKLGPNDKVEKMELPVPPNPFDALFGGLGVQMKKTELRKEILNSVLPEPIAEQVLRIKSFEKLMSKEPRLLVMPFHLSIK